MRARGPLFLVSLSLLLSVSAFGEETRRLQDLVPPEERLALSQLLGEGGELHRYFDSPEQAAIAWRRVAPMAALLEQLNSPSRSEREAAPNGRLFHYENEGVLLGTAFIPPRISDGFRHGLFAEAPGTSWPVMLRYSDGIGWPRRNSPRIVRPADVRGLMIERFIYDRNVELDQQIIRVHDMLMTNGRVPFGNIDRFLDFAEANQNRGYLGLNLLAFDLFRNSLLILRNTTRPVRHLFHEEFFSGHAYRLNENEAFQFNVVTQNTNIYRRAWLPSLFASFSRGNYLRDRVYEDVARAPVRLLLRAQRQNRNRALTPVENVLVPWSENVAPSEIVMVIDVPQQTPMPRIQMLADRLAHSPRHYTHNHHPVGHTGWGRLPIYEELARLRGAIATGSREEQEAYREILRAWKGLGDTECNARVAAGQ